MPWHLDLALVVRSDSNRWFILILKNRYDFIQIDGEKVVSIKSHDRESMKKARARRQMGLARIGAEISLDAG